ncbi:MAG: hypothetical protein H3C57_05790 [Gammaproteobacteria bacterium]|nr:hypothetical protein [Gammaproteobacteria bacterium]
MNQIISRIVAIVAGFFGLVYLAPALTRNLLPLLPQALAIKLYYLTPRSFESPMQALVQMAFGAVLLVFAYRQWRNPTRGTASYTCREEGGSLRFEVTPATAPISWPVTIFALGFAAATVGGGMWIFGAIFVAIVALLLLVDQRGHPAANPSSFQLDANGISYNGWQLCWDEIQHLVIRNKFSGNTEIVYDANRGIPTGRLLGLAAKKKLAAVAYRIEVESAGKVHVLAAGLDATTAQAIAAEISAKRETRS